MVFDGAKATACLRGTDLLLRVEANELLACEGVQALLLATLAGLVPQRPLGILWVPADKPPFKTILDHLKAPR